MSKRHGRGKSYVSKPAATSETTRARYEAVMAVMAGTKTQEEAATELGLSRLRFQTLMHRSQAAMMAALEPGEAGRPAKPEKERALEVEAERLKRENARLRDRAEMIDRMLDVAGDILRGRRELNGAPAKKTERTNDDEDPEPDGEARRKLAQVTTMRELGLRKDTASALVGTSRATVRRWAWRHRHGWMLRRRRGPSDTLATVEALATAVEIVRDLRGEIGAEALAHAAGLTRRQAAVVKAEVVRDLEAERKARCGHVSVKRPGVVRGFDQLVVRTSHGQAYALISADASVPFRTSVHTTDAYDAEAVAKAIEKDIRENGAPLVWRADRCAAHRTDLVKETLEAHGVFALHGPPRHPQYYGQLERQNVEHRALLAWSDGFHGLEELDSEMRQVLVALNELRCRRRLHWRTAAQAWASRPMVTPQERAKFADQVYAGLSRIENADTMEPERAMRLALEQALVNQGYLAITWGRSANGFRQRVIAH